MVDVSVAKNIVLRQTELLRELLSLYPNAKHDWDEMRGVASFVRSRMATTTSVPVEAESPHEAVLAAFLDKYGAVFGPDDIGRRTKLLRKRTDSLGYTHLEYQQMLHRENVKDRTPAELEIYGSKLAAHFNPQGTLIEVQSSCWKDISVAGALRIKTEELQKKQLDQIAELPGFQRLQREMRARKESSFPIMQEPRLVIYPWKNDFHLAWVTFAYAPMPGLDRTGRPTGPKKITFGLLVVNATNGETLLFTPTETRMETPDVGSGLGVTPLGGPNYSVRQLNIVRIDDTDTYLLKDTTHSRDIIVFDAGCDLYLLSPLEPFLCDGTITVSADTDGDKNWNRVAADTTDTERTASQQPEVDAHYFVKEAFEWYDTIAGGRKGWDDDQYPNPTVPPQTINVVTHACDQLGDTCRSADAYQDICLVNGKWVSMLAFFDGDPTLEWATTNDRALDFMSGSKLVVGHEYQHGITNYSFIDGFGNPGLPYPLANPTGPGSEVEGVPPAPPPQEWLSAVHEGLSDAFGGLFSQLWLAPNDISSTGFYCRNFAFPRDPNSWENLPLPFPCGFGHTNMDHFADRDQENYRYSRGTILAHCAYLTGQGGVHQRTSRAPQLIPVYGIGDELIGGRDIPKTARIWYRALTHYLSNIGTPNGIPANDENVFRLLRNACISAADDLYPSGSTGSIEYLTTLLAWYAVGLQPDDIPYGADLTFLRWGWDWRFSQPYIGISSPDWSSVDLFINNGGASEWNALINVYDPAKNPTQYENTVYCRVRNVGDQDALNVQVEFFYTKAGTGITDNWQPVVDKNKNHCKLSLGTLKAGQSNFLDSQQDNPPSSASVKWWIPPLEAGETVDHFCLKAIVSSPSDVNPTNNDVQSNIAYAPYAATPHWMRYMAGNPLREEINIAFHLDHSSLPRGWATRIMEPTSAQKLRPGEQRTFTVIIEMPPDADKKLDPPFNGKLVGHLYGSIAAPFSGILTETESDGSHLRGRFAAQLEDIGSLVGHLDGRLDVSTAEVKGRLTGTLYHEGNATKQTVGLRVVGCLRPYRWVSVSQLVRNKPIGGITVQIQVPAPGDKCRYDIPSTDTFVSPKHLTRPTPTLEGVNTGKVVRLIYDCFGDFSGFVLDVCCEEVTFMVRGHGFEKLLREAYENHWTIKVLSKPRTPKCVMGIEVC